MTAYCQRLRGPPLQLAIESGFLQCVLVQANYGNVRLPMEVQLWVNAGGEVSPERFEGKLAQNTMYSTGGGSRGTPHV
jgi:hypothetical protein